jgi:chromate reductase, NAD(P)H dehydrogenase (quinone)
MILAVSGSLRRQSSTGNVLLAAALLDPSVTQFHGIGDLAHFNPDLEQDEPAPALAAWRKALREADAVLICSPEYAHGVPGVMKNALDWVVGSGELCDKPVGVVNASMRATHAHAALCETLVTMSARITQAVCPLDGRKGIDPAGIAADPALAEILRDVLIAIRNPPET